MQKHTLLVPLGGSTLSATMLGELRDLFPVGETRVTLLQEQVQAGEQVGKTSHQNYETLRVGGYKAELRQARGRLSDHIAQTAEREHIDVLTLLTQSLDTNLPSVNSLLEDVLERVSIPVLFLQTDAQDSVFTTLHPAKEHRPGDLPVEALPIAF